jgi:predicted lipase
MVIPYATEFALLTPIVADIINDVSTNLVTPSFSGVDFPSGVKIMSGIDRPWKAVHDDVISEVKSLIAKYPDYTLEATGHSLGGSLTYISHVALAQNFPEKQITSYALAAFPIGNDAWANFASSQAKGTMYRGNNIADGVPVSFMNCDTPATTNHTSRTCMWAFLSTSSTMEP